MAADLLPMRAHPVLGTLTWKETALAYEGQVVLGNRTATLEILVDEGAWSEPMTVAVLLDQGAAAITRVRARWSDISARVASFLYEAYDEEWRAGRPVLSPSDLLEHLRLSSVCVYHHEGCELVFRDDALDKDGLFFGHYVLASVEPDGEVSDVSLAG